MSLLCLQVTDQITITEPQVEDEEAVLQHLADPEIAAKTTGIPFPFGQEDFDRLIECIIEESIPFLHPVHLAIRDADQFLIGFINFSGLVVDHKAELGYWLAKPLWGRGIMTNAVRAACEFAVARWGLRRISANVFDPRGFEPLTFGSVDQNSSERSDEYALPKLL